MARQTHGPNYVPDLSNTIEAWPSQRAPQRVKPQDFAQPAQPQLRELQPAATVQQAPQQVEPLKPAQPAGTAAPNPGTGALTIAGAAGTAPNPAPAIAGISAVAKTEQTITEEAKAQLAKENWKNRNSQTMQKEWKAFVRSFNSTDKASRKTKQ